MSPCAVLLGLHGTTARPVRKLKCRPHGRAPARTPADSFAECAEGALRSPLPGVPLRPQPVVCRSHACEAKVLSLHAAPVHLNHPTTAPRQHK
eukprot:862585-Amphidinium_carterae.2